MSASPDFRDDLDLALDAVSAAGAVIMPLFRADAEVRHKGPDQPVTDADLAADRLLRERLTGARPADGWLSEETADRPVRLARERVWVVDPIDGTRSFIRGYREFAVSVGLVADGQPLLGVIYNPARDEVYWATRGGGAYRVRRWRQDGGGAGATTSGAEPLRIEDPPSGRTASLLASRSEIGRGEFEVFEADWRIRPWGSTAYKLAGVAAGAGDAFISRGPKSEWDVAAGALIVEEAGGRATDLRGRALVYNRPDPGVHGIVAGPEGLHARLLEVAAGVPAPRLR